MNETQREQIKGALLKCAEENENKPTFTGYVVVSSVCKSAAERIEELEKQLEAEKQLNEEIKVRFVKCNTCTDDMKDKCIMFSENLCEGERCEELVDLMELINKSDLQKENARLKLELEALDGAEFGYNKANEWHYVKDGDLPKENQKCYFIHSNTYDESNKVIWVEDCINVLTGVYSFFYDDEGNETTEPCFYDDINDDEIDLSEVYAWKEIVLPEFPKETK